MFRELAFTVFVGAISIAIYFFIPKAKELDMAEAKTQNLFNSFWKWRLLESPEFATFIGNHDYDDKLESYSLQAFEKRKLVCNDFLQDARKLILDEQLNENAKSNLEMFIDELSTFIEGVKLKSYLFPINYLEGVHIEFERLISSMKFDSAKDYKKLISRLKAVPVQINEVIELLREGIKLKMTNHAVSMTGTINQLDKLVNVEAENSDFYKPILKIPSHIDENEKSAITIGVKVAIISDVLPSFSKLKKFLEKEYSEHLRPNISASSLPNGEQFYQMCLDFHLSCRMSPQEVHDIGLKEVERIKGEMQKVIHKLELKMKCKEFSKKLKEDETSYFANPEEILDAYKDVVFNEIQPKLPKIIKNIPHLNLSVMSTPPSMTGGPTAYYLAGTLDGSRPGTFYVNTADKCPKYEMMTLALHEGEPGHHLQMSYMMEMKDVPAFRQYIEDRKYSDAPGRFALHTSYLEGWGLYSEHLGYELGLYKDPYFEYGHLSFEIFRACRLVVDTGMHFLGWSREKAIAYIMEHTAMNENEVVKEVNRYVTWPGQACAYKIGEIKIKELRKKAEDALGDKFDVREFHDVVLQNAGPLNILQKAVDKYIHINM